MTDAVEGDLAEIWFYFAIEASETIATRFITILRLYGATMISFSIFPLSGLARPRLALKLRVLLHGSYACYYRVIDREISVVRVLQAARDAAALASSGGFDIGE